MHASLDVMRVCRGNRTALQYVCDLGYATGNIPAGRHAMTQQTDSAKFEEAVLPHLDAAYNLARWITRNPQDAEDVVQEAYLRAFRFFNGYHGGNVRSWLLTIVRNACYTWLHQNRAQQPTTAFDEELHTDVTESQSPESLLLRNADRQLLKQALEELPLVFREVLVLSELEGLS
jgi:RNA polymerase sigma-70 factor, ECF subfamily